MPGSERRVVAWSTNVVHSGLANPSAARKSNGRSRIYRNIAVWLGILVPQPPKPFGNKGFFHFLDLAGPRTKPGQSRRKRPIAGKKFRQTFGKVFSLRSRLPSL
jgi:hypothetical protein